MMRIVQHREIDITERKMNSEALKSRYYCYEKHQWQSMGWVEWLLRKFFAGFVNSTYTTCLRYSWKSIEKMPTLPTNIKKNINGYFLASLYHTNPSSSSFQSIYRVFCKRIQEKARKKGIPNHQIEIIQGSTKQTFEVLDNSKLCYQFTKRTYGQFDVSNEKKEIVSVNNHDSLQNVNGERIGGIKLAVNYPRQSTCMELYSGEDCLIANVVDTKDKVNLVFRSAKTNSILAVSDLSKTSGLINWNITVIDEKELSPLLLAWAVFKYSQHYY